MENQEHFMLQDVAAIQQHIISVRCVQVMLDRDLAALYGVEVKQLNRQVRRNIERFPSDFMFQLTKEECTRCQIGTLYEKRVVPPDAGGVSSVKSMLKRLTLAIDVAA